MFTPPSGYAVAPQQGPQQSQVQPLPQGLLLQLKQQVEFYFSEANLSKDIFLQSQLNCSDHPGLVPVATIASFPRIRQIYHSAFCGQYVAAAAAGLADPVVLGRALENSDVVRATSDGHWFMPLRAGMYNRVQPSRPVQQFHDSMQDQCAQSKTQATTPTTSPTSFDSASIFGPGRGALIVQDIPDRATEEDLIEMFTSNGIQPMHARPDVGQSWCVIFDSDQSAAEALQIVQSKQVSGFPLRAHALRRDSPVGEYRTQEGSPPTFVGRPTILPPTPTTRQEKVSPTASPSPQPSQASMQRPPVVPIYPNLPYGVPFAPQPPGHSYVAGGPFPWYPSYGNAGYGVPMDYHGFSKMMPPHHVFVPQHIESTASTDFGSANSLQNSADYCYYDNRPRYHHRASAMNPHHRQDGDASDQVRHLEGMPTGSTHSSLESVKKQIADDATPAFAEGQTPIEAPVTTHKPKKTKKTGWHKRNKKLAAERALAQESFPALVDPLSTNQGAAVVSTSKPYAAAVKSNPSSNASTDNGSQSSTYQKGSNEEHGPTNTLAPALTPTTDPKASPKASSKKKEKQNAKNIEGKLKNLSLSE